MSIDTSIFLNEPANEYHAKAKNYFSSHQLIDFLKCPYLYHKKQNGLIPDMESQAFLLGSAAHSLILEGRGKYESDYAIGGPINPTTGRPFGNTTKKFLEWQAEQQKPVLTFEQSETVEAMHSAVRMNEYAAALLQTGIPEGVIRTEYCGLPCQIRLDWFNPDYGIIDLKTCDDLTWFESDARRFRYQNQMAFYQCVLDVVIGQLVPVYIIAVEKKEPFRCGVWQVTSETLLLARAENEAAIERLKESKAKDCWPTGYEELRMLTII
ncbi:MAG: PD-(D/E)XK nuclease-like domain-containing protein [Planctomycetaceae bacterium]|nr:PD-(D/E)XK nuclease-like domain-containing protein [Planctomycetaceae bacterium]